MISGAVHGSNLTHSSSKRENIVLELTGFSAGRDWKSYSALISLKTILSFVETPYRQDALKFCVILINNALCMLGFMSINKQMTVRLILTLSKLK